MKKILLATLTLSCITGSINAQNCFEFDAGQLFDMSSNSWVNTLIAEKDFFKASDKKKDEMVKEFNAKIEAGKVKGFGGKPAMISTGDITEKDGAYISSYVVGEYKFPLVCKNDTMYLYRNADLVWAVDKKDTIGVGLQGASVFPNQLKIGDKLPEYEDFTVTFPKKWKQKVQRQTIDGYKRVVNVERGFVSGFQGGNYVQGIGTKTTNSVQATFATISEEVEVSQTINLFTRHHVFAQVVDTVTVSINYYDHTAYVIHSEKWFKATPITDWNAENQKLKGILDKEEENFAKMSQKLLLKKGIVNKEGYMVTYITEWFVPGIGVIKTLGYDGYGVLTIKSELSDVK